MVTLRSKLWGLYLQVSLWGKIGIRDIHVGSYRAKDDEATYNKKLPRLRELNKKAKEESDTVSFSFRDKGQIWRVTIDDCGDTRNGRTSHRTWTLSDPAQAKLPRSIASQKVQRVQPLLCHLNPWSNCNKTDILHDFTFDQILNIFAITEILLVYLLKIQSSVP
jgi:hypothetical protein